MTSAEPAPTDAVEGRVLDFFYALDLRDFEALADVMADGGVWHRQGKALSGRGAILAALAERGPDVRTAHVVTNFQVIELAAHTARARFYLTGWRYDGPFDEATPSPMEVPFSVGLYDCHLKRERSTWVIESLSGGAAFRRA